MAVNTCYISYLVFVIRWLLLPNVKEKVEGLMRPLPFGFKIYTCRATVLGAQRYSRIAVNGTQTSSVPRTMAVRNVRTFKIRFAVCYSKVQTPTPVTLHNIKSNT